MERGGGGGGDACSTGALFSLGVQGVSWGAGRRGVLVMCRNGVLVLYACIVLLVSRKGIITSNGCRQAPINSPSLAMATCNVMDPGVLHWTAPCPLH